MTSVYKFLYTSYIFVFIICFDLSLILVLICELINDCCKNNNSDQIDKDNEKVITKDHFIDDNIKLLSNL